MSKLIHALARRDVSFGPEDIAVLAAGLESALTNLHITNRNDPATTAVAKLIIQLARDRARLQLAELRFWTRLEFANAAAARTIKTRYTVAPAMIAGFSTTLAVFRGHGIPKSLFL